MKLSWFNTSMGIHKLYLAYEYVQYKAIQDIKEIEFRDSGSNINNNICFEVRATALRPRLQTEGFPLCPYRTFHKGTSTEDYNTTLGVHYSSLKYNHLYTRGIGTKSKQRKDYNLGDPMITNNIW